MADRIFDEDTPFTVRVGYAVQDMQTSDAWPHFIRLTTRLKNDWLLSLLSIRKGKPSVEEIGVETIMTVAMIAGVAKLLEEMEVCLKSMKEYEGKLSAGPKKEIR